MVSAAAAIVRDEVVTRIHSPGGHAAKGIKIRVSGSGAEMHARIVPGNRAAVFSQRSRGAGTTPAADEGGAGDGAPVRDPALEGARDRRHDRASRHRRSSGHARGARCDSLASRDRVPRCLRRGRKASVRAMSTLNIQAARDEVAHILGGTLIRAGVYGGVGALSAGGKTIKFAYGRTFEPGSLGEDGVCAIVFYAGTPQITGSSGALVAYEHRLRIHLVLSVARSVLHEADAILTPFIPVIRNAFAAKLLLNGTADNTVLESVSEIHDSPYPNRLAIDLTSPRPAEGGRRLRCLRYPRCPRDEEETPSDPAETLEAERRIDPLEGAAARGAVARAQRCRVHRSERALWTGPRAVLRSDRRRATKESGLGRGRSVEKWARDSRVFVIFQWGSGR
jgi:hypothetical protein